MHRTLLAFFGVMTLTAAASAQTSVSATFSPGFTSFGSGSAGSGTVDASGQLEHLFKNERVRIVYELDTGDFSTPGEWRFVSHSAGGSYEFRFDEAGTNSLYVGGDGYLRRNGASWGAADFNGAGAFANLESRRGRATLRTGYRLDVRRFPDSPGLNQIQQSGFGSVLASFESRTTLIGEISVGSKHYEAVSPRTEVLAVPADAASAEGDSHTGQGRGSGWRALANVTLVPIVVPGAPGSDARQVTVFARVAQSLAARTGLSIEFSRRRVFGEVAPSLVSTPAMYIDDGVYDDLFASDATRGGVSLKSIVANGIELAAAIGWNDKRYGATLAFDEGGMALPDVLRRDRVRTAQALVTWPLFPSRTGRLALDLVTGYDHTRHDSTSALYRYTAHTIRVGLGVVY
jgi:hypothetical protein